MQSRGDKNANPATSSQPKHQFPKQLRFPIVGSHPYVSFMCSVANHHIALTYRLLTASDFISTMSDVTKYLLVVSNDPLYDLTSHIHF